MLKIREDIPLEELEKYGFKREYIITDWCYQKEYKDGHYKESIIVWEDKKIVQTTNAIDLLDTLYDLIQAGIVEKE